MIWQDQAAAATTQAPEAISQLTRNTDTVWATWRDGVWNADDFLIPWNTFGWPITKAILLILAMLLVAGWTRRFVTNAAVKARVEITLARFFGNLSRWAILILGGLTILQTFGVEATSFAAALAAVGFAIGMALSGTLGNVAAGVLLLIFRPFRVGHVVNAAGVLGVVDEIGLYTTTFDTFDKRRLIVPNGKIFGDVIENVTHHKIRRVEVLVGTVYSADVDETRAVLERVVASVEAGQKDPAPQVFLAELGASSVNWKLRVWAEGPAYWDVHQRLVRDTKKALDEAGIGIPFPQRDVHIPAGIDVRVRNA